MNPSDAIDLVYDSLEGCEDLMRYTARHGTPSLLVLTQHSPDIARESVELFAEHIAGKTVVEIGAGVGFLAIEMARIAKSVVAIESDPAWSWIFTRSLYRHKPKNLTWIFGAAETVQDIRAEVAVIFTCSGMDTMRELGKRFAPTVLLPLQDEIFSKRKFTFDPEARVLQREDEIRASLHGMPKAA